MRSGWSLYMIIRAPGEFIVRDRVVRRSLEGFPAGSHGGRCFIVRDRMEGFQPILEGFQPFSQSPQRLLFPSAMAENLFPHCLEIGKTLTCRRDDERSSRRQESLSMQLHALLVRFGKTTDYGYDIHVQPPPPHPRSYRGCGGGSQIDNSIAIIQFYT